MQYVKLKLFVEHEQTYLITWRIYIGHIGTGKIGKEHHGFSYLCRNTSSPLRL